MQQFLHLVIYLFLACTSQNAHSALLTQAKGKNKVLLRDLDGDTDRPLRPTLNIRKGPQEFQEMMAGETMFLECEAGGSPPPTINWLKDGRKLKQNEVLHPTSNDVMDSQLGLGFTRSRLYIECASPRDAGSYTCVAENGYIRQYEVSQVFVNEGLQGENGAICVAKKSFGSPAKINMWTHSRLELMGTDVQLFCRASGYPTPHIVWKGPSGMPINSSKKYQFLANGDLVIRNLKWTDMGGYICQAQNDEGADEVSIFLYPSLPDKMEKA